LISSIIITFFMCSFILRLLPFAIGAWSMPAKNSSLSVTNFTASSLVSQGCAENQPGWAPTPQDWDAAGTTLWLKRFANGTKPSQPLWEALGNKFMPTDLSFSCQVGDAGQCNIPDCSSKLTDPSLLPSSSLPPHPKSMNHC
jgi:hypothetical protein